ncbi:MAG: multicopper oxidase family protein, partial [Micromonosporaceae bacterium]
MFGMYLNFSEIIPALTLVFGALAGYRAGQLVYRPNHRRLRASILTTYLLLGVAIFGVMVLIALGFGLLSFGWEFASNRFIAGLPPMLIATVATFVLAVPRLRRLRRRGDDYDPKRPLTPEQRHLASDPRLVVPIQAVGVAGGLSSWVMIIMRPTPPYTLIVLTANGALLVVCALLWLRQVRRQRALGGEEPGRTPGWVLRSVRWVGALVAVVALTAATVVTGQYVSRLPDSFDMGASDQMDFGGGPEFEMSGGHHGKHHGTGGTSVADLTGGDDVKGEPDKKFTLTAVKKTFRFSSGETVEAWTYDGVIPGPVLTVNEGDLVEITLVNKIPGTGLTVHWHGVDVPNAQDGVPGVTQNAVTTGKSHVYRFRMHQVGTFWYHSHQSAAKQVDRGLYGALVSLPKDAEPDPYDITVQMHDWKLLKSNELSRDESYMTFDDSDQLAKRKVPAGTKVRLRVVNTGTSAVDDEDTPHFVLSGTSFRVAATDGNEINQPGELADGTRIPLGTGGRVDLTFTMPDGPVRLTNLENTKTGMVLSPDGTADAPAPKADGPLFDRATYGKPASTPFDASSDFDRNFNLVLDDGPGFYNGRVDVLLKINGEVFPNTPMLMVSEGDLVKVKIVGRGHTNHPMHLHGHQILVLSRNGEPVTGSPWWTDTLEVRVGEIYEFAFLANNPGVWMDHCHNLQHAAKGMLMHLGYEGVYTPN